MSSDESNPFLSPRSDEPSPGEPPAQPWQEDPATAIARLERRISQLEQRIEGTWLTSDSFLLRTLAVLGHWFLAYLLIVLLFVAIGFLINLMMLH